MQYATNPPALASEPNRLLDEFPKWLERISTKIKGTVILVLDSLDLFSVSVVYNFKGQGLVENNNKISVERF